MGQHLSEETAYARDIGLKDLRQGKRLIQRLGGARKLQSLPPDIRNILLSPSGLRDDRPAKVEVA